MNIPPVPPMPEHYSPVPELTREERNKLLTHFGGLAMQVILTKRLEKTKWVDLQDEAIAEDAFDIAVAMVLNYNLRFVIGTEEDDLMREINA